MSKVDESRGRAEVVDHLSDLPSTVINGPFLFLFFAKKCL